VTPPASQLESVLGQLKARLRQQFALAELGRVAIGLRGFGALLREAAQQAVATVDADRAAIVERLPDGRGLRLAAGAGLPEGSVGRVEPEDPSRLDAFALGALEPVVLENVRTDPRLSVPKDVLAQGIMSAAAVPIRGAGGAWGVLTVYSVRPRAFTPDEVAFLQSLGRLLGLVADRHAVEAAQQREKEMLQTIYDNSPVMISVYGDGKLLRANRAWEKTLGWTLEEARKVDILAEAYPDPRTRQQAIDFIRRAEQQWGDFEMRTRDGRALDISWARFALSDGSSIGFGLDVSDRKRVEHALRESETRFRQAVENISEVFWLWSVEGPTVLYVNRAYETVFGRSRESVYRDARSWIEGVHPDDRERVLRCIEGDRNQGGLRMTYRVLRPDGSVRWVRDRAFAIRNAAGEIYRFAAVAEDITESKRAEDERARLLARETAARRAAEVALAHLRAIDTITDNALVHLGLDDLLRELLVRLRRMLDADSAGVQLVDEDGLYLYPRAVDGYVHEGFRSIRVRIGTGLSGRIAAEGRPLVVDDYSTVDTSGIEGVDVAKVRAKTRSVMGAPLKVGAKVVGVVSVVSERPRHFTQEELRLLLLVADRAAPAVELAGLLEKLQAGHQVQKTLSRRLLTAQEEERRRLAVELHDELGQVLTAVKINLGSLERLSGATPPASYLKDAIGSVDRAMQSVRDLALDLRPSVLDDFGLPAALRWYADRFARTSGVTAHLAVEDVARLAPELETACFRVAQEALTNVARHAHARNVWIGLRHDAGGLELGVRDDGIGFDVRAAHDRAGGGASIGLLGMRERVSLLGGDIEIRRIVAGGTEVWIRFPLLEEGQVTA
jgi:PAS domain S-box-containing protein